MSAAGDGHLTDGSPCSNELREYLGGVSARQLFEYAQRCLDEGFPKSGSVLQDLVNEIGRRLDYHVENGLYQGRVNAIGFDGIWEAPNGHSLIVEVKTTDTYRISLDTIAAYREALISRNRLTSKSSVLIVVGRQDTGEIEAQIRGSRHAWDMRLISVEALQSLVMLKESAEEDKTVEKIRSLLAPFEYTRLDNIVDVMFTAARDVEAAVDSEAEPPEPLTSRDEPSGVQRHTPTHVLQQVRDRIVAAVSASHKVQLVAHKRALYWSADRSLRLACSVSKFYERNGYYWYAYHPAWDLFLKEGGTGLYVLGCVDRPVAYALPYSVIASYLDGLNTTVRDDGRTYWHIVMEVRGPREAFLAVPKRSERVALNKYELALLE